jgi:hypothetical protein
MIDYKNGKIYKIVSEITDEIYVGSTTQKYLSSRMAQHRGDYRKYKKGYARPDGRKTEYCSSFIIVEKDPNAKIIFIANAPSESKAELEAIEREHMKTIDNVINKNLGNWLDPEYVKAYNTKYKKDNYDKLNKKINCECGGKYTHKNKASHFKSKIHMKEINKYNKHFIK